jgi:diguanylate cyclase (GGDEF)-like protein
MSSLDRSVLRFTAGAVALIAGTMLLAWALNLQIAIRDDTFEPMSPLSCVGFLLGAAGAIAYERSATRLSAAAGALMLGVGVAGLVDSGFGDARWLNVHLFGIDAPVARLTAVSLVLLGASRALEQRVWPLPRALAAVAALVGLAALVGFMLGVPQFYGPARSVQMSWQAALCSVLLGLSFGAGHMDRTSRLLSDRGLVGSFARRVLPATLLVPVLSGTLCMAGARAGWFSFEVAAWLMTLVAVTGLAAIAGIAIAELAKEEQRLTDLAIRDPLTGAYNRRHFLSEARTAAGRAQRYGEQAAIAVVDLDHFKEINDQWGHAVGDEALVRSYRALRSRLRSSDVLGRIGGDEFAALVLHVDEGAALQVAAEMREAVAQVGLELRDQGRSNRLTASVGVASLHVDDPRGVEELIDLADQRMYLAKRANALTE